MQRPSKGICLPSLAPGQNFAGYELLSLAGRGGVGIVFKAHDRRLDRRLAIKVLRPDRSSDPRAVRRLMREARACSTLAHPGIVSVYAAGEERGYSFIAMEWVEGISLANILHNGSVPVETAVNIARQLAEALSAVHALGMIHRDVTPRNVMVGEDGRVTLIDFGAVGTVSTELSDLDATGEQTTLTSNGLPPGTVAYMSPEQALGEPLDARSDIFSLGVVTYEMLAGVRPFDGSTLPKLVRHLLFSTAPPLAAARPGLPDDLVRLVESALERDARRRPRSMAELAARLEALDRPTDLLSSVFRAIRTPCLALLVVLVLFGLWKMIRPLLEQPPPSV
jgi:serine/threonine protein kinase